MYGLHYLLEPQEFNFFGLIARRHFNQSHLIHFFKHLHQVHHENISHLLQCLESIEPELLFELECRNLSTNNMKLGEMILPNAFQLDLLDNNNSDYNYYYPEHNYSDLNVSIFILDTGIYWKHEEFEPGQVIDLDSNYGIQNISSPHGTGTACAASGKHYGASKNITLFNYPVCRYGGSCGSSDIENGFFVALNYLKQYNSKSIWNRRIVINLSVGANYGNPIQSSLGIYYDSIFKEINDYGGIIVVAAGNSNMDACGWLYGYSPNVISVGSINANFNKSVFSNYGDCVDIWSFGENVPLAYSFTNDSVIQYKSGTSFSSPLIAGVVANLLIEYPNYKRADVLYALYNMSLYNRIVPNYVCGRKSYHVCSGGFNNSRIHQFCNGITNLLYCNSLCQVS